MLVLARSVLRFLCCPHPFEHAALIFSQFMPFISFILDTFLSLFFPLHIADCRAGSIPRPSERGPRSRFAARRFDCTLVPGHSGPASFHVLLAPSTTQPREAERARITRQCAPFWFPREHTKRFRKPHSPSGCIFLLSRSRLSQKCTDRSSLGSHDAMLLLATFKYYFRFSRFSSLSLHMRCAFLSWAFACSVYVHHRKMNIRCVAWEPNTKLHFTPNKKWDYPNFPKAHRSKKVGKLLHNNLCSEVEKIMDLRTNISSAL